MSGCKLTTKWHKCDGTHVWLFGEGEGVRVQARHRSMCAVCLRVSAQFSGWRRTWREACTNTSCVGSLAWGGRWGSCCTIQSKSEPSVQVILWWWLERGGGGGVNVSQDSKESRMCAKWARRKIRKCAIQNFHKKQPTTKEQKKLLTQLDVDVSTAFVTNQDSMAKICKNMT